MSESLAPLVHLIQYRVKHIVIRQGVRVFLVWPQFCRRSLCKRGEGYHFPIPVDVVCKFIDVSLVEVCNHHHGAGEVSVKGSVSGAEFTLVGCVQQQGVELVGVGHKKCSPDSGLQVLFRYAPLPFVLEDIFQSLHALVVDFRDRNYIITYPEVVGQIHRVLDGMEGGKIARQHHSVDILLPKSLNCQCGNYSGIYAAGQSQDRLVHFAALEIAPYSFHQFGMDFFYCEFFVDQHGRNR